MAFWIAAATLAGSAYQADRARKSAKEARLAAEREAAVTQSQTQQQIELQQQQAGIAKERLAAETAKYAEQKAQWKPRQPVLPKNLRMNAAVWGKKNPQK